MEEDELFENEMSASAKRFEEMYEAGGEIYMDHEELEDVIEYYMSKREFRLALRAIHAGIDKYPFERVFQLLKAEVLYTTFNYQLSLEILEDILLYEPLNAEALQLKADVLIALGQIKEAIHLLETCLPFTSETHSVKATLYRCYMLRKQKEKAESMLLQFFQEEDHELLYHEISLQLLGIDYAEMAFDFYEWYTNEFPERWQGWMQVAISYEGKSEHEKCITACDFALVLNPDDIPTLYMRAYNSMEIENYDQAIDDYQRILTLDGPDAISFCRLAACHFEKDQFRDARKFYRKALKEDDEMVEAWYGLAMCYKVEEKYKEAMHFINRALDLEPDNQDYHMDRAEILIAMGELDQALEVYLRLAEINPADEEIWLNMATLYAETDQLPQALECLYEALKFCPETPSLCYRLASYHFMLNDSVEGIEFLEKALDQKFEDHFLLFLHAPELQEVSTVWEIIDVYRKEKEGKV